MTPQRLVRRALAIAVIYAALHALGLRSYTSILTSTVPTTSASFLPMLGVAVYLVFYVLAWMLAPILVITAGILALGNRLEARRPPNG